MSELDLRAARPATEAWQTKVARLITEAFAPVVLIFVLLIVVSIHATGHVLRGLAIGLLAAMFAGGLPYGALLLGIHRGHLGDRHLSRREERPLMMVLGLASVTSGLLVMRWMHAPRDVYALVAAMVAGVAVALAISMFWKISIHSACVSGSVMVLCLVLGPAYTPLAVVAIAVAWARVDLGDHTLAQVVLGLVVGAATAGIVMVAM